MKKQIKRFAFAALAGVVLTSCADSASINQQAASSYTQEMGNMRAHGVIDTSSKTAKRVHAVFNKWCLMQTKRMKLDNNLTGKSMSLNQKN